MSTSVEPPRDGLLIPGFALPRVGGGEVRARAYRNRRSLAVIFVHGAHCRPCRDYLAGALESYADLAEQDAEVIAVVPAPASEAASLRRSLALPFPVAVDESGAAFRRFGLEPARDAAVMVTDRYGEPRLWTVARDDHALPAHEEITAELRYLVMTCSAGCAVPLWQDR